MSPCSPFRKTQWLRDEVGEGFPEKVTAFHDRMAVHGRFKLPCPVCGRKTAGGSKPSRLLKDDWPKSIDDL